LGRARLEAVAWILALGAGAAVLAWRGYRAQDADSRLYAEIAVGISRQPVERWIAPEWPPGWYRHGHFREHPVGIHVLPALLARLGYPAAQAAYAVNGLYQVLTLVLLVRLASTMVEGTEARSLAWLVQLLPIAFIYRIRANHEPAVVLCLLVALLGTEGARTRRRDVALIVVGLVGLLLVKGVLAVLGPAACALWLLARHVTARAPAPSLRPAWIGLALASVAMGVAAVVYELAYRRVTGESFFGPYLGQQLGIAAMPRSAAHLADKAYNLVWYLGRVLWFPFPWSLILLGAARSGPTKDARARAGILFVAGLTVLYVGLFSLSDRRADRYIFPVYYAVGAAGILAAQRLWPRLGALAARVDRRVPLVPVGLWVLLFVLHLLGGPLGLPIVKVWGPEA
jgi:4-amino-4-deoxy-L-arabinose transferase-like glycosyltransferase